jgi:hypothetical protein
VDGKDGKDADMTLIDSLVEQIKELRQQVENLSSKKK